MDNFISSNNENIDLKNVKENCNVIPFASAFKNKQLKFLFFNKELLLQAPSPEEALDCLKKLESLGVENLDGFQKFRTNLINCKEHLSATTEHFNKRVKDLKRFEVKSQGFHLPNDVKLTSKELRELSRNNLDVISQNLKEKMAVRGLTKEDIIKPIDGGKQIDWFSHMIQDGKVFPYTILIESELVKHGFPVGLFTQDGQDIDISSIKNIFYIDPETSQIKHGIYFEVQESAGPLGEGGINGIIAPANKPLVIMNYTKKEAYFITVTIKERIIEKPSLDIGIG